MAFVVAVVADAGVAAAAGVASAAGSVDVK